MQKTVVGCLAAMVLLLTAVRIAAAQDVMEMAGVPDRIAPRVVFIPGILGSRLARGAEDIWGDFGLREQNLFYAPGEAITASPLSHANAFGIFSEEIYGGYFSQMAENLASEENFSIFSYDWRASNIVSAELLRDFVCQPEMADRPIIFVAHSMGGLVLKHWIRQHFGQACADGATREVAHIFFVATPHTGAPKSVVALLHHQTLIENENLDRLISGSLNKFGITFDSFYELFPSGHAYREQFVSDQLCTPPDEAPSFLVGYRKQSDDKPIPVDLFSAQVLLNFGIAERFTEIGITDPRAYLQDKLTRARQAICALADFRLPEELLERVDFIVANQNSNREFFNATVRQFIITNYPMEERREVRRVRHEASGKELYFYSLNGYGDSTVPVDAASMDIGNVRATTVVTSADHLSVLNDTVFQSLFERTRLAFVTAGGGTRPTALAFWNDGTVVKDILAAMSATPSSPDLAALTVPSTTWDATFIDVQSVASNEAQIDVNLGNKGLVIANWANSEAFRNVVKGDLTTPEQVYIFAEENPSAENWLFASSVAGLSDEARMEATENAALRYYEAGMTDYSIELLAALKPVLSKQSIDIGRPDVVAGRVYASSGWLNAIAGDEAAAQADFMAAANYDPLAISPNYNLLGAGQDALEPFAAPAPYGDFSAMFAP